MPYFTSRFVFKLIFLTITKACASTCQLSSFTIISTVTHLPYLCGADAPHHKDEHGSAIRQARCSLWSNCTCKYPNEVYHDWS